jgi:DNA polymerase-3 subunit delta
LAIACTSAVDKKTGITAVKRRQFLTGYLAPRHQAKLAAGAADLLIELMGDEMGMLDTEIAKLALYRPPGATIDEALVHEVVSGWQGKTVWQITDAVASGNAAEALVYLDKLMSSGQKPIAIFPQLAFSLRRLGMATAIVLYREGTGQSIQLDDALGLAGIRWSAELQRAKRQLIDLGRPRGKRLLEWLLDTDLRLKGTHSNEGRDRFLLEQLVIRMAKTAAK